MARSIRISDELYGLVTQQAEKDSRTLAMTLELLVRAALKMLSEQEAASFK